MFWYGGKGVSVFIHMSINSSWMIWMLQHLPEAVSSADIASLYDKIFKRQ